MSATFLNTTSSRGGQAVDLVERVRWIFRESQRLGRYASGIRVTIEGTAIILNGELPSDDLKQQLVPTIQRAGVLWQVCNLVQVSN